MTVAAGDAHPFPIYNARFRLMFPILDADGDLVTGAAGLDSELSQNQGTFADATNEATEIATSSGMYYLDLIATELDTQSTVIIVKTSTSGAKTTPIVLYPVRLSQIRTGTAQAGASTTITLDSGASAIDNYYVGCYVNITNNTPTNAQGQARRIISYVGSTKVATVEAAWGTNPSSSSQFEILATAEWTQCLADINAFNGIAGTFASGRPEVNTTHIAGSAVSTSSAQIGVNVVNAGGTVWSTVLNDIADAILKRDWTSVTGEAARSALNALRFLRNKWSIAGGTLTVTKENDTTSAWTAPVTTDAAAEPITGMDPS